MKAKRSNWHFIALIGAILVVLLFNSFREKPKYTPVDDTHRPLLEALARGESREKVEKGCADCHNPQNLALPAKHPPKEQCLICHPGPG